MDKMRYVVGFLFDGGLENVVLIEKLKPDWQKGRLNGVGGKIEDGEGPLQAMVREFEEETGYRYIDWRYFCNLSGDGFEIFFYCGNTNEHLNKVISQKELEKPVVMSVYSVQNWNYIIPNLKYLIPMAKNRLLGLDSCELFYIKESIK